MTVSDTLHVLHNLFLITTSWDIYSCPHFINEKTKTQRVTGPYTHTVNGGRGLQNLTATSVTPDFMCMEIAFKRGVREVIFLDKVFNKKLESKSWHTGLNEVLYRSSTS